MQFSASVAILFCVTTAVVADETARPETPAEKPDVAAPNPLPPGAKPVAIHILTRNKKFQHFYSINQAEVDNLTSPKSVDPHGRYRYWGILGYGSSKPGDGLTKLNRGVLTTGGQTYATFYVQAPKKLDPRAKIHLFPVWVWQRKQPGLVPVYGISDDNWRNVRFITDRKTLRRALDQAYKTRKIRLKNHGVMFYIKPLKPATPNAAPKPDDNPNGSSDSVPKSDDNE